MCRALLTFFADRFPLLFSSVRSAVFRSPAPRQGNKLYDDKILQRVVYVVAYG